MCGQKAAVVLHHHNDKGLITKNATFVKLKKTNPLSSVVRQANRLPVSAGQQTWSSAGRDGVRHPHPSIPLTYPSLLGQRVK